MNHFSVIVDGKVRYKYETHCHTAPVSKCAGASVRDTVQFYKDIGYDGVFITNHFIDGNISIDHAEPYEKKIEFYFTDYEEALKVGHEIDMNVFLGIEMTHAGTDFLVYGLGKEWFLAHPEIEKMPKSKLLPMLMEEGALVVQAHPFREAGYIDHIRLFPRGVQGVETINANRTDFENHMAEIYANEYGFVKTAGSDNHVGARQPKLAGMMSDTPLENERDFINRVLKSEMELF